jgi:hypothetical protein
LNGYPTVVTGGRHVSTVERVVVCLAGFCSAVDGVDPESAQRSESASLTPRPRKAAAKVRRIQASTRGRDTTWWRTHAATMPWRRTR